MKILFDFQIYNSQKYGGITRYFNELSDSNLFESNFISPKLIPEINTNSILYKSSNFIKKKLFKRNLNTDKIYLKELKNIISNNNTDIFHPTYYSPYYLNYINKPFVITVHDMLHEIFPENFYDFNEISKNKKMVCEKASMIIAISETTKYDLMHFLKIPEEKIKVIFHGTNFDKIIPLKPNITLIDFDYILYTGTRGGYKNFYFFIRAISEILMAEKNLKILCTGPIFTNDEILFFINLGISSEVIHVNIKNDNELSWLYKNAKCFVFPSLYEGFGLPLLEAFASEVPVVSSNGGSLKEIGSNAVMSFNPKSYLEIQDSVLTVLNNDKIRRELINNGKIQFSKYSWEKCQKETFLLYNSLT